MSAWLPISDAPKDGTLIIGFLPEEDPQLVVLQFAHTDLPKAHPDYWEGWLYRDETLSTRVPEDPEPTHWMPLPEPPSEAAA